MSDFDEIPNELNELDEDKFLKILSFVRNGANSEQYVNILISWLENHENPSNIIDSQFLYQIDFQDTPEISLSQCSKFFHYCVKNSKKPTKVVKLYNHIIGKVNEVDYDIIDDRDDVTKTSKMVQGS